MARPHPTGERERVAFDAIVRAAKAGERCPSNDDLCGLLNGGSSSIGARAIKALEQRGMIVVTRFQCGREVFVPSIGKATAAYAGKRSQHWRERGGERRLPAVPVAKRPVAAEMMPPVVNRDPCPRCGTRADIGCTHSPAPVSMGAFA